MFDVWRDEFRFPVGYRDCTKLIWLHCGWSWLQDTPESSTDGYLGPGYLALLHRVAFLCSAVSDTYCIGQRYRILHVSSPPDPTRSRSVQRRIPTEAD